MSVLERTQEAMGSSGAAGAVSEIEASVSSGDSSVGLVCQAALLVLSGCADRPLCERLAKSLSRLEPGPKDAYLVALVISLCNCDRHGRVGVDVQRFKDLAEASSAPRPAILAAWQAMELFNQGRGQEAIEMLSNLYASSRNLWVRDLLMKSYLRIAYNHIAKEQYEQAADVLKQSLQVDSYNVFALHSLAILETQKTSLSSLVEIEKSWSRLIEIWTALNKAYPDGAYKDYLAAKYMYFAARFLKAGSWARGKLELANLVRIDPDNALGKEVLEAISN
ncbi:MAG TPA: hypothetical protein VM163_06535 [bacterium]|nr:hypothetical protein [bacterium]